MSLRKARYEALDLSGMPDNLCAGFQNSVASYPDDIALSTFDGRMELTWREYGEQVRALAAGLASLGISRGDAVAMMLTNRPEAFIVDAAALHLGATPVSIYNTSAPEQIAHLLENANSRVVVTETQFVDNIRGARSSFAAVEHVFVVDGEPSLEDLASCGAPDFDFDAAWRTVAGDDVAVLIYTSGTTGPPKGVEITHASVVAQVAMARQALGVRRGRVLSYLPLAHLADRVASYYPALCDGSSIVSIDDPRAVVAALPQVRPTSWVGIPRVWEKLKAALEAGAADKQDPAVIRRSLGLDEADLLLSGSAPIAPEVLEFFAALGLTILEAWGMSESTSAGTSNTPGAVRFGTVGRPLPGMEVALAEDDELLLRGPAIMRGYRKEPQRTAEAITEEGWLRTGDIGEIDADGFVKIVDRKKELIINAAGKNMSPANIENALKAASSLIGPCMAVGDRRPYNTALIVLDPDVAAAFAREHGLENASLATLSADARVEQHVADAVERANARLSRVEQIKRFTILPVDWLPSSEELTPTMKLRRRPIADKYAAEIDAMYEMARA